MYTVHLLKSQRTIAWDGSSNLLDLIEAKRELYLTPKTVKEIAYELGYEDGYYFSRFFKTQTGISPQSYRETVGFNRGGRVNTCINLYYPYALVPAPHLSNSATRKPIVDKKSRSESTKPVNLKTTYRLNFIRYEKTPDRYRSPAGRCHCAIPDAQYPLPGNTGSPCQ